MTARPITDTGERREVLSRIATRKRRRQCRLHSVSATAKASRTAPLQPSAAKADLTEIDQAMRSRLIVESVWLPSAFVPANDAQWTQRGDAIYLAVPVHGEIVRAKLDLGPAGELQTMRLDRWSDLTDDRTYGPIPFESRVESERTFGDLAIRSELHATWRPGTDGPSGSSRPPLTTPASLSVTRHDATKGAVSISAEAPWCAGTTARPSIGGQ
jgi:hypothetical protein